MNRQKNIRPPGWPLALLRAVVREDFLEEIEGDMEEVFRENLELHTERKARLLYAREALLLIRPAVIRKSNGIVHLTDLVMIKNYLTTGWRNFLKYRSYSTINIVGLCAGFVASLLLFLIINYERSFDRFHDRYGRIYRVAMGYPSGDLSDRILTPEVPLLEDEYPDIVHGTRFFGQEDIIEGGGKFIRGTYHIVDSGFAEMFDFPALEGSLKDGVSKADHIVLTASVSERLFGSAEVALGQTVSLVNEKQHFVVSAVIEDPPRNSSLQFEILIPWQNAPDWLSEDQVGNWYNTFMEGYVELSRGTTRVEMEEKLIAFSRRHFIEAHQTASVVLLPLANEHFRITSSQRIVTILGLIAGAILLISCINFMNLTVSQLLGRLREIGVRKVMGSRRWQLIIQFMVESLIVCFLAVALGLLVTYLVLPVVNDYFGFGITDNYMANRFTLLFVIAICLITGLMSSGWPSLVLSRLKPVNSIKGAVGWNKSGGFFRKGLIVIQFGASILLIIGTFVVWRQIQFMKSQDMHFNGTNVVSIEAYRELFKDPEKASGQIRSLRDELTKETAIDAVSLTQAVPGSYWQNYNGFIYVDSSGSKTVSMRQITVDHNFFDTFRMKILYGRNFSNESKADRQSVIINETAMKRYGWTDINGKMVRGGGGEESFAVIGVVEDYYYQSLKDEIQPVVHFYNPDVNGKLAIRFHRDRVAEGLELIREKWSALESYEPFDYTFVDKAFDELYKEQEKLGITSTIFSLIAVIIAGMGLFSITAYSIRLRRKEVGIRKTLGASVQNIVMVLSGNFGWLVLVGFIVACPAAYYLMSLFLEDFSHRIALAPWIFILAGGFVFVVAMLLVGIQSGKAALENPVNSLREE